MIDHKKTGSYYTPSILSDYLVEYIFSNFNFGENFSILEPSCGDGNFIKSFFKKNTEIDSSKIKITLVDKNRKELNKAYKICIGNMRSSNVNKSNKDFLSFQKDDKKTYKLIIGNPPYIKKNHLTDNQIKLCEDIHRKANLSDMKIKNIWTSFLVASIRKLNQEGILCLILPGEFLQVNYANELRKYLMQNFKRIEILSFNELIFPSIEQDVIVVIAAKNVNSKVEEGISFFSVNKLKSLKSTTLIKKHNNIHRNSLEKWTNYLLSEDELGFLDEIKTDIKPIKEYCENIAVGIVTGCNDYFIVRDSTLKEFNFKGIAKSILSKGAFVSDKFVLIKEDIKDLHKLDKKNNLLLFERKKADIFTEQETAYLNDGKALKINKKYKCSIRDPWYKIPSRWASEGIFIKRTNIYPKLLVNEANVLVTDSFYRVVPKKHIDISKLAFSFNNTLSFIISELEGRYYGGGVLELTPNEFKKVLIPYCDCIKKENINYLDKLYRKKEDVHNILNYTNKIILNDYLGLNSKEIKKLDVIYSKLLKRRLKK